MRPRLLYDFGGPGVAGGMTFEEREKLLETEQEFARAQQAEQRALLAAEEVQREARERAQRLQAEMEEGSRISEIERLEEEAAEESFAQAEDVDEDNTLSDMFSALFIGATDKYDEGGSDSLVGGSKKKDNTDDATKSLSKRPK